MPGSNNKSITGKQAHRPRDRSPQLLACRDGVAVVGELALRHRGQHSGNLEGRIGEAKDCGEVQEAKPALRACGLGLADAGIVDEEGLAFEMLNLGPCKYPEAKVGASSVGSIHPPAVFCDLILLPLRIMTALINEAGGLIPSAAFLTPLMCQPSRKYWRTRAAEPAQSGVDMLVPDLLTLRDSETNVNYVRLGRRQGSV